MKGDGAAIPSERFLRGREQPLITLCSHASPPPPPPPPRRPSQCGRGPPAGRPMAGVGCGDVRAARNVPSDSPVSLTEVRAAPSVCPRQRGSPPPAASAPRLPPPPAPPPASLSSPPPRSLSCPPAQLLRPAHAPLPAACPPARLPFLSLLSCFGVGRLFCITSAVRCS